MKTFNEWLKIREGSPDKTLYGDESMSGDPNDPNYQWFLNMKKQAANNPLPKRVEKPVVKPSMPTKPSIDPTPTMEFSPEDMMQAYYAEKDPAVKQFILQKIRETNPAFKG